MLARGVGEPEKTLARNPPSFLPRFLLHARGLGHAISLHGCTIGYSREALDSPVPRPRCDEAYPAPVVGHPLHLLSSEYYFLGFLFLF
mgnify:CR=1 FL=1